MDVKITRQDAEKVAEVIRGRFDADIVRGLDMGLSYDHDGDECIRIVVHLDKNPDEEVFRRGVGGVNGDVIDVLRDELKHLYPYIRFAEGELDDES